MKNKNFCEECRDDMGYEVVEIQKKKIIKGKEVIYNAKMARCNECGKEMFVHEIRDHNLEELDRSYRNAEGIIQTGEIINLLKKYNIKEGPLSVILGCSEDALASFLDGDLPSKEYSEMLKKINDDPDYLLELLEKNKEEIADSAYAECIKAIENVKKEIE